MTTKPNRWEASAARSTARRVAQAPLLAHAGLVVPVSADDQAAHWKRIEDGQRERADEINADLLRRAGIMRERVRAAMPAEDFAALDAHRARYYPDSPGFLGDFWRGECLLRGLPTEDKPGESEMWARVRAELEAHYAAQESAGKQGSLFGEPSE